MAHGGARNRSGPPADPDSRNSARKGVRFNLLPAEGYRGAVPPFPLPDTTRREGQLWVELWKLPQAQAWAAEPWRIGIVAMYCRVRVRAEAVDASVGLYTQMTRLGDQIGMTPAGMAENGWRVATDELAAARARLDQAEQALEGDEVDDVQEHQPRTPTTRRLRGA